MGALARQWHYFSRSCARAAAVRVVEGGRGGESGEVGRVWQEKRGGLHEVEERMGQGCNVGERA